MCHRNFRQERELGIYKVRVQGHRKQHIIHHNKEHIIHHNKVMATVFLCLSNQFSSPKPTTPRFSQSKNFMYQTSLANPNPWQVICAMSSQFTQMTQHNGRRSANYQQSHWKFEFLQCLGNDVKVIFYIFKLIFVFFFIFVILISWWESAYRANW